MRTGRRKKKVWIVWRFFSGNGQIFELIMNSWNVLFALHRAWKLKVPKLLSRRVFCRLFGFYNSTGRWKWLKWKAQKLCTKTRWNFILQCSKMSSLASATFNSAGNFHFIISVAHEFQIRKSQCILVVFLCWILNENFRHFSCFELTEWITEKFPWFLTNWELSPNSTWFCLIHFNLSNKALYSQTAKTHLRIILIMSNCLSRWQIQEKFTTKLTERGSRADKLRRRLLSLFNFTSTLSPPPAPPYELNPIFTAWFSTWECCEEKQIDFLREEINLNCRQLFMATVKSTWMFSCYFHMVFTRISDFSRGQNCLSISCITNKTIQSLNDASRSGEFPPAIKPNDTIELFEINEREENSPHITTEKAARAARKR